MYAIGIDMGGTNLKSALIHKHNGIIQQYSTPTNAEAGLEATLDLIARTVKERMEESPEKPFGIGIGAPGMISLDRKTVSNPPNLPGWDVVHLAEEIQQRTGLPCLLENDANLMALGSARFGSGAPYKHFIMITLGTGVGGGIIYNNVLFRGATGSAGELGHVIIDYNGPSSNSSAKGGVEAYLGQRFLSRRAADEIKKHPDNELYTRFRDNFDALEPVDLTLAAEAGNQLAVDILSDAGRMLGYALVNYIHTLDIRKIVVSGGVAKSGKWILDPAREAALSRLMGPFHADFEIIPEKLGNESALLGAGVLALENL